MSPRLSCSSCSSLSAANPWLAEEHSGGMWGIYTPLLRFQGGTKGRMREKEKTNRKSEDIRKNGTFFLNLCNLKGANISRSAKFSYPPLPLYKNIIISRTPSPLFLNTRLLDGVEYIGLQAHGGQRGFPCLDSVHELT